jgi:hypothetical protein
MQQQPERQPTDPTADHDDVHGHQMRGPGRPVRRAAICRTDAAIGLGLKSSLPSARDIFTYTAPAITTMTPTSGPISGGTYLTITGGGFIPDVPVGAGHTRFHFGGIESPDVLCSSSTSCTVRSPQAAAVGDVSVAAQVFDAPPAVSPVKFSYHARPALKAIAYSTLLGIDGSVDLDGFAPPGGTVVALSSSDPALVAVPPTMTVDAGLFSGNFTATLTPTDTARTVTLTATLDGVSVSTGLALEPGPPLVVVIGVPALAQGSAATAHVSLNQPAPPGGAAIALVASDPSALSLPASVVVPAGEQTASFTVPTPSHRAAHSMIPPGRVRSPCSGSRYGPSRWPVCRPDMRAWLAFHRARGYRAATFDRGDPPW